MNDESETALWAWFLFQSGLATGRAKILLDEWLSQGLSLREALSRSRSQLGISPQEAALLHPPSDLPHVTALRCDDNFAPAHSIGRGLMSLPLKLRPALLFYRGEVSLLSRPLVYLAPSPLDTEDRGALHEAISLLVDEPLLLGAYEASPQLPVLIEELAYSTGEAVIFARTGLAVHRPSDMVAAMIEQRRIVLVSPLPPQTAYHPAWDAVLQQVAMAAAQRILLTGEASRAPSPVPGLSFAVQDPSAVLALTAEGPEAPIPPGVHITSTAADVLPWVDTLFSDPSLDSAADADIEDEAPVSREDSAAYWVGPELTQLVEEDLAPLSTDEILNTLSKGGTVPDALRRRIQDKNGR